MIFSESYLSAVIAFSAAVMGRLDIVTIIHGKGTGALRKAVHDILRRNKAVKIVLNNIFSGSAACAAFCGSIKR